MSATIIHLLHRASQVADSEYASRSGKVNVTSRQAAVLAALVELNSASQQQLTRDTGIDRSTMAHVVARLLREGLIERKRSGDDARAYEVRLTDKGTSAAQLAAQAASEANDEIMKRVPPSLREDFNEALRSIALGKLIDSDKPPAEDAEVSVAAGVLSPNVLRRRRGLGKLPAGEPIR